MIVYILTIILFTITFHPKIRKDARLRIVTDKLKDFKVISSVLLIWIVLGFFTRLDFSQRMGDMIFGERVFDYNNIGFSTILFTLILISRFATKNRIKLVFLLLEITIWLIRLFYYKGGYAVGIAGNYPLDLIVMYDTIGLFLRLQSLYTIKNISWFREWRIYIYVLIIISIKIFLLPVPHDLFWETMRIKKKTEQTKSLVIGNWEGIVNYNSSWFDTLAVYRLDTLPDDFNVFFETGVDITHSDSTHKYALKEIRNTFTDSASLSILNAFSFSGI